ncbi:MAG: sugar porter family MFS transporter [Bacteroidales bacterium]|nr:sugar porter family MFS transporter [Bacteroidales bacterium]
MNKFSRLLLISMVAALGGLLFGFDIAIITGAGPYLVKTFDLNNIQEGWAYSSLLFGCILGAAVAGRITDTIGRKKILLIVAILFALTSIGSALAFDLNSLVVARIIGGIAVGAASTVSPMYISEITPKRYRGSLVSMYQLFIVTGILVSYLINYSLNDIGENNWRWMFATGTAPSLLFLITIFLVPETPRYLFKKGDKEKALEVLEMVNTPEESKNLAHEIDHSLQVATSGFKSLLDPSLRKVMLVGFGLAVFVQLSGINTIIDYAPKIFTTAGWRLDTGLFATFGLGIVNFIFTWVSILVIDKFGRRPLYILGSAGLALTLLCLSILDFTGNFKGIAVLIIIMIYLAFFSSCIGPVFWTYMSEIFPNRIRGTALSVPVFTQWIFNALVVLVFPLMLTKLQSSYTFLIIFFLAAGQLLFSWAYMKETKGKSLEEIEDMWKQETRQIT